MIWKRPCIVSGKLHQIGSFEMTYLINENYLKWPFYIYILRTELAWTELDLTGLEWSAAALGLGFKPRAALKGTHFALFISTWSSSLYSKKNLNCLGTTIAIPFFIILLLFSCCLESVYIKYFLKTKSLKCIISQTPETSTC